MPPRPASVLCRLYFIEVRRRREHRLPICEELEENQDSLGRRLPPRLRTCQPAIQRARVESRRRRQPRPHVGPAPLDKALPERARARRPTPAPVDLCGEADDAHVQKSEHGHEQCVVGVRESYRLVDSSPGWSPMGVAGPIITRSPQPARSGTSCRRRSSSGSRSALCTTSARVGQQF